MLGSNACAWRPLLNNYASYTSNNIYYIDLNKTRMQILQKYSVCSANVV
jgi:ribosomal protein S2